MKNRIICMAAAAALILGSCTDLDVDVSSRYYTSFPEHTIAYDAVASGCYTVLKDAWGNWYSGIPMVMSVSGGENIAVSLGTDYYDGGCRQRATLHCVQPSDYTVGWYSTIMGGITKVNTAILQLGLDEETTDISVVHAQLRTVRAFYHWLLMDAFGDTPKLDRLYDSDEPVERISRKEITEWIAAELEDMLEYLPTEVDKANYGRPTRWMAQALLAKIYLNWNVYTASDVTAYDETVANPKISNCIAACDDIINSGLFNLGTDYKAKFLPTNGWEVKDFIYAFSYNGADKDGNVYGRYHTWRRGQNDGNGGAGLYNVVLTNSVGGCFTMNPDFSKLFCLQGDRRNDCIYGNDPDGVVYQYGADYEKDYNTPTYYKGTAVKMVQTVDLAAKKDDGGNVIPVGPSYTDLSVENNMTGWTQGWHSNKYILEPSDYNLYSRNCSNDMAVFRYADVLLMKAEAILRNGGKGGGNDTPESLFNQIRSASNAPAINGDPTLQDILDERGRELFDEGWRRNDMIRFGQYETPTWLIHTINPSATDKRMRIFPIPESVMQSNTNWTQNPGY